MNPEKNITTNLRNSAVRSLVGPEGQFAISGDGDVTFLEGTSSVTDEQITTEMARIQAEYDSQEYARNRKLEYPSIDELVVALYDEDDKAAIEAKRAEIKAKYPKP
jgi:hypothetical protein|tara:strand:- start:248 stop:565 length:318 start_codon:yes stop_codon:yes gene_type:complete